MIKINLIPEPRSRLQKEILKVSYGNIIAATAYIFTIIFLVFYGRGLSIKKETLNSDTVRLEAELERIKKVVAEVKDFEQKRTTLNSKLKLITGLREKQMLPVHIMDDISNNLPNRVWLTSMKEEQGNLTIDGMAISNIEIVTYINNLKKSIYFSNIKLLESVQKTEDNFHVYTFKLTMHTSMP